MRRYWRSMRRRRRSMWKCLRLGQRRRRSRGGHSMRRYRRLMWRRQRSRSYRRYRHGVSGDIGDCGVGITPQMCNRVTNHGDMSTFSKPVHRVPVSPGRAPISSQWMASVQVFHDVSQCFTSVSWCFTSGSLFYVYLNVLKVFHVLLLSVL